MAAIVQKNGTKNEGVRGLTRSFPVWAAILQNRAMLEAPALPLLDEASYHPRLSRTRGSALVLFSSPDCGSCRRVETRLPVAAPPGVALFKVDVQAATALARAFDIFHLPTLFLYREGRFHARLDCEVSAPALAEALERALAQPAQEEP